MKNLIKKIRLRTWIALGVVLVLLPIVLFRLFYKEVVQAASMTVEETSTQITIFVPNRYNAVLQKGDTDDYILFYDRVEDDQSPDPTHEIQGPCILETNTYCLRDDAFRTTHILEQSSMRVRIRVYGRLNNEASTDYLDDDAGAYDTVVTEDYTFTTEGLFVRNVLQTGYSTSLTFDADSGHNGYEWLGVWADVTDAAFDDTANIIYGDGHTESTTTTDGGEFANTNTYVVLPGAGTDTYQDAFIGMHHGDWYDGNGAGAVKEWHWDIANSGTQDLIAAQEQVYAHINDNEARWFFLLKDEDDLDTEAEREALANMYQNPDILSYTTGSARFEEPVGSQALYFDGTNDDVMVPDNSAHDFADGQDFTIEAWVSWVSLDADVFHEIVTKRNQSAAGGWTLTVDEVNLQIEFTAEDGTDTYSMQGPAGGFIENKWNHVAVVWDDDTEGNTLIYVNGVSQSLTRTGTFANIGSLATTNTLCIGSIHSAANTCNPSSNDFEGKIDEVRIWNDVRTSTEIQENMRQEVDPASGNLVGYWRFNEGNGSTTEDYSSTGADGSVDAFWSHGKMPDRFNTSESTYSVQTSSKVTDLEIDANDNVSNSLNGTLADGATTVTVNSTTGFASSGTAYINGDRFTYTGTTATTFTGVPSSGENAVDNHASGEVVSQFNRIKPNFKIGGFKGVDAPSSASLNDQTIRKDTDFNAQVKPTTNSFFHQDISFSAPMVSTTVDIGSNLTNSGCTFAEVPEDVTFLALCDGANDDITFTSTDNIDYTKGAIEFLMSSLSAHTDNTERTYFNIASGGDQFRFRKTTGNTLEFLIDEGATTYTESVTSANYSWALGTFQHIRLEWDDAAAEADQMKIIINGVEPTHTDSTGDFTGSLVAPGTTFRIGNSADTSGLHCNCAILQFYIFDYNGSGDQAGSTRISSGKTAQLALNSRNTNQTLSLAPVDSSGRGEYLYLGTDTKVNGFNIELDTNGASAGTLNLDWEYWNGLGWTDLESTSGFTDTTANLTQSGSVSWTTPPTNWKQTLIGNNNLYYYIRASLNNSSGSYTTSPIESKATTDILEFQYLGTLDSEDQTFLIPTYTFASVYWSMDEGYGTVVSDGSGNKNEGFITNALWQTEDLCISHKCLLLDGSGDYVYRSNDEDFNFTAAESFTISTWFRHGVISTASDYLITKHNSTAGGYKIYMDSDGDIVCGIDDDSSFGPDEDALSTNANYDDNRWHHVSCVKDGTSTLTLYIDGKQVDQDTSISGVGTLVNTDTFYVGIDGDGSSNGWQGFVDEVKIYPYARSANEVAADFVKGSGGTQGSAAVFGASDYAFLNNGLVGYWKLDEASGNAADSSGNATTLTNNDTTAFTGAKYGNGAELDGAADYFEAADNETLSVTGDLTLSAWINNDDTTGSQNIVGKWDGTNNSYLLALEGDELRMYIDSVNDYETTTATNLSSNAFVHVAGVYQASTQTVQLFVNGVLQASTTTGTIPTSIGDDAGEFVVGADDSPANFFDGHIDEVRVYSRSLSPSEVRMLSEWAPGPVGYWKLDDNTGTSAVDSSGYGNTGTLTNSPSWTIGKYGPAVNFADSDQHIVVADDDILDFADDASMSFSAFIKHDTANAQQIILSKFNEAGYKLIMEDDGDITCGLDYDSTFTPTDSATSTAADYDDNQWHHVACVKDGASNLHLYIDGELIATDPSITASNALTNSDPLYIGIDADASSNDWTGQIDDVKIYHYARTPAQIIEDLNAGHPIGGSPIGSEVIYWRFDEGFGTTAYNDIDANTDGTLSSIASPATSTSGWTQSGKINRAIVFDGSNDNVNIPTASDNLVDFNGSETFSLGAWVYVTTAPGATDEDIIIGKWDETGAAEQRGYRLYITDSDTDNAINLVGEIYDESADQSISAATTNEPISLNTWYHVLLTFNGGTAGAAGDLEIYLNAESAATNSANASFLGLEDVTSDFAVADYDATDAVSGNTAFAGRIDEVVAYSAELTASQAKVAMNSGSNAAFSVLASTSEEEDVAGSLGNPPIAWLSFDENTGTAANDSSGQARSATFGSQAVYRPGKIGTAAYFDGTSTNNTSLADDSVVYFTDDTFDGTAEFSISFWFKPSDTGDDWQNIWGSSTTGAGGNYMEIAYVRSVDQVAVEASNCDGGTDITGGAALPGSQTGWHHVTYTNGSSGNRMYIDGVPVTMQYSVGSSSVDCGIDDVDTDTTPYTIGCWHENSGANDCFTTEMYEGYVDEFKLYDYVRTSAQASYEYNRGAPTAWYKIDDCTGTTINDLSLRADLGNGNDGTWSGSGGSNTSAGSCTTVNTATAWYNGRNGKYGSSLDFDGTDDVVTVTNASHIDMNEGLLNGVSFAAWIYVDTDGEGDNGHVLAKSDTTFIKVSGETGGVVTVDASLDLSTDATVSSSFTVSTGAWHHVALAWSNDDDDEISLWVDGKLAGTSIDGVGDPSADASNFFIGNRSAGDRTFDGRIDDVRVYPYELTSAQVKKVMLDGASVRFGPTPAP